MMPPLAHDACLHFSRAALSPSVQVLARNYLGSRFVLFWSTLCRLASRRKHQLNWNENSSIRLVWKQVSGAFSLAVINVRGPRPLWEVPLPRQEVRMPNKLTKSLSDWRPRRKAEFFSDFCVLILLLSDSSVITGAQWLKWTLSCP